MTSDSVFAAIRDSIVAADEARRIRRERAAVAAAEAERVERTRTVRDSTGTVWLLDKPPGFGTNQVITRPDTVKPKPDTTLVVPPPVLPKIKMDSIKPKPDTIRPKPDTMKARRR
jgi:hypothetical protein